MTGCSPDMKDGLGPRVPIPNVEGEVVRAGVPAARTVVSVRRPSDSQTMSSVRTGPDGAYAIAAPPGEWEIKVSGGRAGDFDSVTREFSLVDDTEHITLPAVDVSAWGAGALAPPDSAEVSWPVDSAVFEWTPPSVPIRSARVQIYDHAGVAVWYSDKGTETSRAWHGDGNQGVYAGPKVPAGVYQWRVKFELPDSSEARLPYRSLIVK